MRYIIFVSALLFFMVQAYADPRAREVQLHKRTVLTVYIVPDLGTRFTFPFILDEEDNYVPFTLTPTNEVFKNDRVKGRNYFVITAPGIRSTAPVLGNLFVNVAGFEITIELRTTNDLNKLYSDIVFNLTDEDRENLIQKGVAQRTKALDAEYKKKFELLETDVEQKSIARIGRIALSKPIRSNIKEEASFKLKNGDKVSLYVDAAVNYDPYTIFVFQIINDSGNQGVSITDAKIFSVNKETKQVRPLDVGKDLPDKVQAGETKQAALTVLNTNLNEKEFLKLELLTDKGKVEVTW